MIRLRLTILKQIVLLCCLLPARFAAADATTTTLAAADATTDTTTEFKIEVVPEAGAKTGASGLRIGTRVELQLVPTDPKFDTHRITGVTSKPDAEKWEQVLEWRLDFSKVDAKGAGRWISVLKPFETGSLDVPDAIITWKPEAGGEPKTGRVIGPKINIQSVLSPTAKNNELTPLRDPISVPRDWSWLWGLGIGLLAGALAAWVGWRWWKRRGRGEVAPEEPQLPPGLWALHEIDRRSRLPVCTTGPAKVIFTLVSEVVRLYLERRYGISAIDMTTIEAMRALQQRDPGDDVMRWVQSFLDECDMIKFTKIEPAHERWLTIWNDARLIVKMTTPPDELGEAGAESKVGAPEAAA